MLLFSIQGGPQKVAGKLQEVRGGAGGGKGSDGSGWPRVCRPLLFIYLLPCQGERNEATYAGATLSGLDRIL